MKILEIIHYFSQIWDKYEGVKVDHFQNKTIRNKFLEEHLEFSKHIFKKLFGTIYGPFEMVFAAPNI